MDYQYELDARGGVCQRSCRVIRILGGQPAWHFHPFRIQRHEALGLPIARVA